MPWEPGPDQLVLTNPIVISGDALVANFKHSSGIVVGQNTAAAIYLPGLGALMIALRSFPGALQAEANWGDLNFTWEGRSYSVRTASPITGGTQPRTVWVALDSELESEHGNTKGLGGLPFAPVP